MNTFQTTLVTGANRGIGLALASQLGQCSDHVIAACRDPSTATELLDLTRAMPHVRVVRLDVTDGDQVDDLVRSLGDEPLDLLLNNAGVYGPKRAADIDLDQWRQVLEVNTLAPIHLATRLMDRVRASRRRLIVNVSSKVGSMTDNGSGGAIVYRSSKAALNAATRSLAIDHRDDGVIAFVVHPGWVQTEMGGPGALIDVQTSARQLVDLIAKAGPASSGGFFDRDGSVIPW